MNEIIEMKSAQDIANEASVNYYADKIKSEMKTATCAWRAVAQLFASASNEFGTDSDKFKALLIATNFSRSKVAKLIAVANNERLKIYEDTLQSVSAWTVMYDITTLSGDEFQKFIASVDSDTVITTKEVNAARVKETVIADPYKTVFSIQIDENAIKAQLFSGDDYQELLDAIETIQNTMNYVRVQQTNLFENDVARFAAELDREYKKQVRKVWSEAKSAFIANSKSKQTIAEVKEDIQAQFNAGDYKAAFSFIGSDAFDQNELWEIATRNVYKMREKKFALKASAADAFANTEIQVAA
jgi:ribosomal protein L3